MQDILIILLALLVIGTKVTKIDTSFLEVLDNF